MTRPIPPHRRKKNLPPFRSPEAPKPIELPKPVVDYEDPHIKARLAIQEQHPQYELKDIFLDRQNGVVLFRNENGGWTYTPRKEQTI